MKKFLLFLTLFLSAVGIATAAESSTILCDFTASSNIHGLPKENVTTEAAYTSKVNSDLVLTLYYAWWQKSTENSYLAFKKTKDSGKQEGYVKINPFKDKIVTSLTLTFGSNNIAFDILLNDDTTPIGKIKSGSTNGTATINIPVDKQNQSNVIIIKTANINNQIGIKKIEFNVVDAGTSGGDEKDCGIAFTKASGAVTYGETFTLPFQNDKKVAVTFSSDNEDVAAVDANTGAVTIKGIGTANIKASFAGNTTYDPKEVTFTLTVTKRFTWSDTRAVLVTDALTLKPGDVIIIANQEAKMAMSTNNQKDYREQTSITFNSDKSEITSDFTSVLLLELEQYTETVDEKEVIYWGFKTVNYTGDNGYLGNTTQSNYLRVNTGNILEEYLGKIEITDNVATIKLKKGQNPNTESKPKVINLIQFNKSAKRFSCYGAEQTDGEVYIYRLEGSTTITGESADCKTPVENGNTTLTASSKFKTNSTASEFVVKMNGVAINATVEKKADNMVSVNMEGLPYVPGAVFTISPVVDGKELHPVTLGITIPTLPVVDLGAVTLKLYFDKDAYGSTSTSTCNLDAWAYLPVVLKDAVSGNELAANDPRRNLALTFKEFANSEAGTQIWGWYDENKDQVQWCKYDYLTSVPVDKTDPENPTADLSSIDLSTTKVELTFTPVYSFNVANKFASLIPSATPGSLSAPARVPEGFTVQNVELTALPVLQAWGNTPDVSGVESVVVEGVDGAVEYYNMQGVRVEGELAPGMYIRRQGRSVSKVQIR